MITIQYKDLNARQKENYNFAKVSAVLADYGFVTTRLTDDWQGADFLAHHIDGQKLLKVQLKGRLTFDRKYEGKDLWVAFTSWYLYPHDELLAKVLEMGSVANTKSWKQDGLYSFPSLPTWVETLLEEYRLSGA